MLRVWMTHFRMKRSGNVRMTKSEGTTKESGSVDQNPNGKGSTRDEWTAQGKTGMLIA